MATTVHLDLRDRSYDILIGARLLEEIARHCKKLVMGKTCLLVTDTNVEAHWASACSDQLVRGGYRVGRVSVPAGEATKDGRWLFHLYDKAVEHGLDRHSFVVALGGGVIGDLVGFMAATFLRGIRIVQAPTTLLAMVDSAVGGKTGINLPQGKNLVGAFHQPALVICDLDTLSTLPPRERMSGLAEVVKYGVIRDPHILDLLEKKTDEILKGKPALLEEIIAKSCAIKARVVEEDEREGGMRAILNFGHTVGHALENVAGYGTLLHGEAIAVGMVFAARLSVVEKGMPKGECDRLIALLRRLGLPVSAPEYSWSDLRQAIEVDKKGTSGTPKFVLASKLGSVVTGCDVPEERLAETWKGMASLSGKS